MIYITYDIIMNVDTCSKVIEDCTDAKSTRTFKEGLTTLI